MSDNNKYANIAIAVAWCVVFLGFHVIKPDLSNMQTLFIFLCVTLAIIGMKVIILLLLER